MILLSPITEMLTWEHYVNLPVAHENRDAERVASSEQCHNAAFIDRL